MRQDGYEYARKVDAHGYHVVKEHHVKLQVGGNRVLSCYYSQRDDEPTFGRRIYWLLDSEFQDFLGDQNALMPRKGGTGIPRMGIVHSASTSSVSGGGAEGAASGAADGESTAAPSASQQALPLSGYAAAVSRIPLPSEGDVDPAVRGVVLVHYLDSNLAAAAAGWSSSTTVSQSTMQMRSSAGAAAAAAASEAVGQFHVPSAMGMTSRSRSAAAAASAAALPLQPTSPGGYSGSAASAGAGSGYGMALETPSSVRSAATTSSAAGASAAEQNVIVDLHGQPVHRIPVSVIRAPSTAAAASTAGSRYPSAHGSATGSGEQTPVTTATPFVVTPASSSGAAGAGAGRLRGQKRGLSTQPAASTPGTDGFATVPETGATIEFTSARGASAATASAEGSFNKRRQRSRGASAGTELADLDAAGSSTGSTTADSGAAASSSSSSAALLHRQQVRTAVAAIANALSTHHHTLPTLQALAQPVLQPQSMIGAAGVGGGSVHPASLLPLGAQLGSGHGASSSTPPAFPLPFPQMSAPMLIPGLMQADDHDFSSGVADGGPGLMRAAGAAAIGAGLHPQLLSQPYGGARQHALQTAPYAAAPTLDYHSGSNRNAQSAFDVDMFMVGSSGSSLATSAAAGLSSAHAGVEPSPPEYALFGDSFFPGAASTTGGTAPEIPALPPAHRSPSPTAVAGTSLNGSFDHDIDDGGVGGLGTGSMTGDDLADFGLGLMSDVDVGVTAPGDNIAELMEFDLPSFGMPHPSQSASSSDGAALPLEADRPTSAMSLSIPAPSISAGSAQTAPASSCVVLSRSLSGEPTQHQQQIANRQAHGPAVKLLTAPVSRQTSTSNVLSHSAAARKPDDGDANGSQKAEDCPQSDAASAAATKTISVAGRSRALDDDDDDEDCDDDDAGGRVSKTARASGDRQNAADDDCDDDDIDAMSSDYDSQDGFLGDDAYDYPRNYLSSYSAGSRTASAAASGTGARLPVQRSGSGKIGAARDAAGTHLLGPPVPSIDGMETATAVLLAQVSRQLEKLSEVLPADQRDEIQVRGTSSSVTAPPSAAAIDVLDSASEAAFLSSVSSPRRPLLRESSASSHSVAGGLGSARSGLPSSGGAAAAGFSTSRSVGAHASSSLAIGAGVQAGDAVGASESLVSVADSATGQSLLHLAAAAGSDTLVAALLAAGADVNVKDANGLTPITVAMASGNQRLVSMMQDCAASSVAQKQHPVSTATASISMPISAPPPLAPAEQSSSPRLAVPGGAGAVLPDPNTARRSVVPPLSLSAADRHALVESFASLSLREKCAVAVALQDSAAANAAAVSAAAASTSVLADCAGVRAHLLRSRSADEHAAPSTATSATAATIAGVVSQFVGSAGIDISDAGDELGMMTGSSGTAAVVAAHDQSAQDEELYGPALPAPDAASVAHAMSLMSSDERLECQVEAKMITTNVRAWLVRRNYLQLREATKTLQGAIRKLIARRRRRDSRGATILAGVPGVHDPNAAAAANSGLASHRDRASSTASAPRAAATSSDGHRVSAASAASMRANEDVDMMAPDELVAGDCLVPRSHDDFDAATGIDDDAAAEDRHHHHHHVVWSRGGGTAVGVPNTASSAPQSAGADAMQGLHSSIGIVGAASSQISADLQLEVVKSRRQAGAAAIIARSLKQWYKPVPGMTTTGAAP